MTFSASPVTVQLMTRLFGFLLVALVSGCNPTTRSVTVSQTPSAVDETASTAGQRVAGVTRLQLKDESRDRPVWIDLWYPAASGARPQQVNYGLGVGLAARNAPAASGKHPLFMLSHGTGSAATNYAWLAEELARAGYIVAGVNHYRDSRVYGEGSLDPLAALQPWPRTADLVFAHREILKHPIWGALTDTNALYLGGHSAGGHTALAVAGVSYDLSQMGAYCASDASANDHGCLYVHDLSDEQRAHIPSRPVESQEDHIDGVRGVLLLDPGMVPSFEEASLAQFSVPTLVAAAVPGDFLPFEAYGGRLLRVLPHALPLELPGAGHFSFLPECNIAVQVKGVSLCEDRPEAPRAQVHRQVVETTLRYFHTTP